MLKKKPGSNCLIQGNPLTWFGKVISIASIASLSQSGGHPKYPDHRPMRLEVAWRRPDQTQCHTHISLTRLLKFLCRFMYRNNMILFLMQTVGPLERNKQRDLPAKPDNGPVPNCSRSSGVQIRF